MTAGEIRKIVVTQAGIIFFVPCAVAILHALFAMYALGNILKDSIFAYSSVIFIVYVAMQAAYFAVSCLAYMRSIMSGSRPPAA